MWGYRTYDKCCHQYIQNFYNGAQISGDRCICVITDVFPPYVVYITAFDALIALPFLYRSYRVQEVLTEFRSGLHILLFQYFRLVCLTAGRGDDSFALAWRMARCLTGVYAMALATSSAPPLFSEVLSQDNSLFLPLSCIIVYELLISCFYFLSHRWHVGPSLGSGSSELPNFIECIACLLCVDTNHVDLVYSSISQFSGSLCRSSVNSPTPYST
jgi:hypothetical protein